MLNIDEALLYVSGSNFYQKRLTCLFGLGQVSIVFLVMGIPLMFPEFDEICDKRENCRVPSKFSESASAELSVYGKNKHKIGYIGTAYFVGMMIFSLIVSWLSDSKGRKTVIFISAIISSVVIFMLAISWDFNVVVGVYFLFGGAELGVYCSGFILITESVEPSKRNIFSGAALCTWGIGSILLMILFMTGLYWRAILIISFLIMVSYIFLQKYIFESPRWFYQNNLRSHEAKNVLNKISLLNGKGIFDLDLKYDSDNIKRNYSYLIFLKNKELFKTVTLCILIWFNVVLVYYSMIFLMASFIENVYLEGLVMAIGETAATVFVSYFVNVIGRKKAAIFCFLFSTVCFMLIAVIPLIGNGWVTDLLVLVLSFFARAAISGEFNLFYIYIAELFPTSVRNMAFGLCNNIGRLGGIVSSNIPLISRALNIKPAYILSFILILSAILSAFLEETLNKDLQDNIKDHQPNSASLD